MDRPSRKTHWETVYAIRAETQVSWYQDDPKLSLELIDAFAPEQGGRIIDIGGGASVLVDRLLERPFEKVAVLDISETALEKARARLGDRGDRVDWIAADVTTVDSLGSFDLWHDRAVFHFLTDAGDRSAYVDLARRTIPPGGHLILATFAKDGPTQCSNLDVCRYDAEALDAELGDAFERVREARELHQTPSGASQSFIYAVFRRR